jgi:glycosyltransferase involved in cell wall biosynthesis
MSYGDWVKKLAQDVGGCDFVEAVPREDLPSLYGRARVVVVPSRFENFSMVALEAMASGRAVVITETSGIAPLIMEHGIGRVVSSGDPPTLAAALRPFIDDANYASEIGTKARDVVRSRLDPSLIAEQLERAYRKAIQLSRGG